MAKLQVAPAGEYHVIDPRSRETVVVAATQAAAYRLGADLERQGTLPSGWWVNCPKGD